MIRVAFDRDRLEKAGFVVADGNGVVRISHPLQSDTTVTLDNGELVLITQRSAMHRSIAGALGAVVERPS